MSRTLKKLKKLRGRGVYELRVRGAQMLTARAERYGWSQLARLPEDAAFFRLIDAEEVESAHLNAESLLAHFRRRGSTRFFASFADREGTLAELRSGRFGSHAEELVIERARRIAQGRFDLLGFRDLQFGAGVVPDFHLEPLSGKRAPLTHWSLIEELGTDLTGDKKIIWELNRQQYLSTLGRAYFYTGDEAYAQTFVTHLTAWMDQNPPKLGVNWMSSLEIAFRSISWLWALNFFKDSKTLTAEFFLRALKFLYLHARHLETYLSTYSSPNTHLTGEALGLFYLGTLLPQFRAGVRWRALGSRIMLEELQRQVRADGVYFEQSSYYHRYTTDFYTHLYILTLAQGRQVKAELTERLTALLDHLMYITRPDGTTPFFGDDDGGRLVRLDERAPDDFRAALSTAAALFNRPDYKYIAKEAAQETLWLLGPEALRAFDRIEAREPEAASRAFTDGGYYVMRDGWSREANYLLMSCGPHGALSCGHSHADALSFDMAGGGRKLLVDPGTYTYTGSIAWRDRFRGSAAHNTLMIDDEGSSVPGGPFTWQQTASGSLRAWISRERFDYFAGTHDGYARLAVPAAHERELMFLKGDYWIMRDHVMTEGTHRYDLRFHFAADASPLIEGHDAGPVREERECAPGLELVAFGRAGGGAWHTEQSCVSRCYGERTASQLCIFSATAEGEQEFITFMIPRDAGEARPQLREIETEGGHAFELIDAGVRDLLLMGSGQMLEAAQVSSDFRWTWLRFERETGELKEMVLLDGSVLRIDGRNVFEAVERIGHVAARRAGARLRVETNSSGAFTIASFGAGQAVLGDEACQVSGDSTLHVLDGRWQSATSGQVKAETLM